MTLEYVCDALLLKESRDFGAHSLASPLFPNATQELSIKTKVPPELLRDAFDKLVEDGYYEYGEGGQKWVININNHGRWFREYGGYAQLKMDREREEDRVMRRAVDKSTRITNTTVIITTIVQLIMGMVIVFVSILAYSVAKQDLDVHKNELRLQQESLKQRQSLPSPTLPPEQKPSKSIQAPKTVGE